MSDPHDGPLFSVRALRAGFDGRTVLSVDTLDIAPSGVTVLVGENGSGKTTLLRVLNGLLAPIEGSIHFRGIPWEKAPVRAQSVMLHQAPLLFRGTVAHNVGYGLRLRRVPREEIARRAARALERVGLPGFEGRRAAALSGGEKQRVALARALVLETPVLMLDEPTANVDPDSRDMIEGVLRGAAAEGVAIIMSTHATETAYRLCDEMVRLEVGRIVPSRENILKGTVELLDEQFTRFRVRARGGGGAGQGPGATGPLLLGPARRGDFRVAVLPMDELLLSLEPLASSARNQLRGKVSAVEPHDGLLKVTVDCGTRLAALVTPSAAAELRVAPGRELVVTFKASAVRLY